MDNFIKLRGQIEQITFSNEENGFTIDKHEAKKDFRRQISLDNKSGCMIIGAQCLKI